MPITLDGSNGITTPDLEAASGGSSSTPPITVSGDTNTGIFFPAGDTVAVATGGVERARFNSTGALVLGGGSTSASGVGITFPATQSASTDANTLDDYEEGTFTPAISSGSGGPVTLSVASGQYTKIGNVVNFRLRVTVSNANSAGGVINITGLPFTVSSTIAQRNRVVSGDISNVTGSTTDSVGGSYAANNSTQIAVLTSSLGNPTLTNTSSMDFNGTYFV